MKICVYAISKNEEKFTDRWVTSMKEADHICVLDTGSTDRTVEKLADMGVRVSSKEIRPWRFDRARNESMSLIPEDADICVCTDLDEVFRPGWREALERAWKPGVEQVRYSYIWSFDKMGRPGTQFLGEKIHAPGVFEWCHPVHEVLRRTDGAERWGVAAAPEIVLEHHPDCKKSRSSYLPLLELSVKEAPEDDRNAHYLGREYMYYGMYRKAIEQLKRHLAMKSAVWEPERCASMRFISRCYMGLGEKREAMRWALRAIAEAPETREPWVQAVEAAYSLGRWQDVLFYGSKALCIRARPKSYINEERAWGIYPLDAMAYACYKLGDMSSAREFTLQALKMEPENERLKNNMKYYGGDEDDGRRGHRAGGQREA